MDNGPIVSDKADGIPDPEVPETPTRRRFDAPYKLRILVEADRCTQPWQLGALLRREGLYSSLLATWRSQRDQGTMRGLTPKKRGRKAKSLDPLLEQNRKLQRDNDRLRARLETAHTIIEFQKGKAKGDRSIY